MNNLTAWYFVFMKYGCLCSCSIHHSTHHPLRCSINHSVHCFIIHPVLSFIQHPNPFSIRHPVLSPLCCSFIKKRESHGESVSFLTLFQLILTVCLHSIKRAFFNSMVLRFAKIWLLLLLLGPFYLYLFYQSPVHGFLIYPVLAFIQHSISSSIRHPVLFLLYYSFIKLRE